MPFSMICTTKGCGKAMEPYLDPKTDKVYCSLCNQEITNVTYFAKMQMKTLKQFKQKTVVSFAVKCVRCGKEARPKLVNDDVVCSGCNKPLDNLSIPFKNMLKEQLKTVGKDI
jgi:DNA-directed RNA polymerase subunit RPC12/RpoP